MHMPRPALNMADDKTINFSICAPVHCEPECTCTCAYVQRACSAETNESMGIVPFLVNYVEKYLFFLLHLCYQFHILMGEYLHVCVIKPILILSVLSKL